MELEKLTWMVVKKKLGSSLSYMAKMCLTTSPWRISEYAEELCAPFKLIWRNIPHQKEAVSQKCSFWTAQINESELSARLPNPLETNMFETKTF